MTDLEQRLRDELNNEISRLVPHAPEEAPRSVLRRIRGRQATAIASAVAIVAAAAGLTMFARSTLDERPPTRAAHPPVAGPKDGKTLVGEGVVNGGPWKYYIFQDVAGNWCESLELHGSPAPVCGASGYSPKTWSIALGGSTVTVDHSDAGPLLIHGWVPLGATQVAVDLDSGERLQAPIYEAPEEVDAPTGVFFLVIDDPEVDGYVRALGADEEVIAEYRVNFPLDGPHLAPRDLWTIVGSGTTRGGEWDLFVFPNELDAGSWCIGLDWDRSRVSSCGVKEELGAAGGYGASNVVIGPVPEEVTEVRYEENDGGVFSGQVFESPEDLQLPFDLYVVFFDRASFFDRKGHLIAMDDGAQEVDRLRWPPS